MCSGREFAMFDTKDSPTGAGVPKPKLSLCQFVEKLLMLEKKNWGQSERA